MEKELILRIIEDLEDIENDYDMLLITTAVYLYGRYDRDMIETLDTEDIRKIMAIICEEDTIFNEELNDYMRRNFEV